MDKRSTGAKMMRLGSIGDPAVLSIEQRDKIVETARDNDLSLIGYTHGWKVPVGQKWKGTIMASADSLDEADLAVAAGWRPTAVISDRKYIGKATFRTRAGNKVLICPAQRHDVTCNQCRKCDGAKSGPIIAFIDHGPTPKVKKDTKEAYA